MPEPGTIVSILEPFKRLIVEDEIQNGDVTITKRVTAGIIYRFDNKTVWDNSRQVFPKEYQEFTMWSPAYQLPDYAIRRKAVVTGSEIIPLQSFTKREIKLLRLDYESQCDPQILMAEFSPDKDFELLYKWWKQHYKNTLRNGNNPNVAFLRLSPRD